MEIDVLNHYVWCYLKSVEQQLNAYMEDNEAERLHHIRLDIKKIKAIYSFAEAIYNESFYTNELNPIFNKAGKMREIQINIKLLHTFPQFPKKLIARLKKKENSKVKKFIKNIPLYIKYVKYFREEVTLPKILPDKKTIKKYFKKERQKANNELKNKDREGMHQFRIKIKKMMYVYNILPEELQKKIELDFAAFNKQQKKIGKWHDTFSAIQFISNLPFSPKTEEYISILNEKEKRQFNAL